MWFIHCSRGLYHSDAFSLSFQYLTGYGAFQWNLLRKTKSPQPLKCATNANSPQANCSDMSLIVAHMTHSCLSCCTSAQKLKCRWRNKISMLLPSMQSNPIPLYLRITSARQRVLCNVCIARLLCHLTKSRLIIHIPGRPKGPGPGLVVESRHQCEEVV